MEKKDPSLFSPKSDGRGKHSKRPRAVSQDVVHSLREFIVDLLRSKGTPSHYVRRHSNGTIYLPHTTTLRHIHEMVLVCFSNTLYTTMLHGSSRRCCEATVIHYNIGCCLNADYIVCSDTLVITAASGKRPLGPLVQSYPDGLPKLASILPVSSRQCTSSVSSS